MTAQTAKSTHHKRHIKRCLNSISLSHTHTHTLHQVVEQLERAQIQAVNAELEGVWICYFCVCVCVRECSRESVCVNVCACICLMCVCCTLCPARDLRSEATGLLMCAKVCYYQCAPQNDCLIIALSVSVSVPYRDPGTKWSNNNNNNTCVSYKAND